MEAESPLKSWFCPHQNRRSSWCFVSPRLQVAGCRAFARAELPSHVPAAKPRTLSPRWPPAVPSVAAGSFLFSFLSWETGCSRCFR